MRSVIVSAGDMLYSRGRRERLLDEHSPAPYALTPTDVGRIWAQGVFSMLPEMPLSVCDLAHEPWRAQHAEAERDAMRAWCRAIPGMGFDAHESAADWWRCLGSVPPKARTRFGKDGQPIILREISNAHDLALQEWRAVSNQLQLQLQDVDRLDAGKRAFVRALLLVCQTRRDHLELMLLQPPYVPPASDRDRETAGEREQRLHRED